MTLSSDEISGVLDRMMCRPGGVHEYELVLDDEDPTSPVLEIIAYTHNSRDDRWFDEFVPDDLPSTLRFRMPLDETDCFSEDTLVHAVCLAIAQFAAHEALEWVRIDGRMAHDPHVHGEPRVSI